MTSRARHPQSSLWLLIVPILFFSVFGCTSDEALPTTIAESVTSTPEPPTAMPTPTDFPPATPTSDDQSATTSASFEGVYLAFSNGFMVYKKDTTCLYAYNVEGEGTILRWDDDGEQYRYCIPFDELPVASQDSPADPFGRVWAHYAHIAQALGAPQGDILQYTIPYVSQQTESIQGSPYYSRVAILPDGTGLYCGMRSATASSCIIG